MTNPHNYIQPNFTAESKNDTAHYTLKISSLYSSMTLYYQYKLMSYYMSTNIFCANYLFC